MFPAHLSLVSMNFRLLGSLLEVYGGTELAPSVLEVPQLHGIGAPEPAPLDEEL